MANSKAAPELILASGSTYKRSLLARLGLDFDSRDVDVDEARLDGEAPEEMASRLALAKARAVESEGWVIGADQVIALGDEIFSKPGTVERAVDQLERLQGQVHRLITAVSVVGETTETRALIYEMHMRTFSRAALEAYVRRDRPLDCAGSYKIEEGGIRLFSRMVGDDYTAIVGLPLTVVWQLLGETGYPLVT